MMTFNWAVIVAARYRAGSLLHNSFSVQTAPRSIYMPLPFLELSCFQHRFFLCRVWLVCSLIKAVSGSLWKHLNSGQLKNYKGSEIQDFFFSSLKARLCVSVQQTCPCMHCTSQALCKYLSLFDFSL